MILGGGHGTVSHTCILICIYIKGKRRVIAIFITRLEDVN